MKQLIPYLRPYFSRMGLGMFVKFAGTIMDLLLPWILAHIIDKVIPLGEMSRVWLWGGAMFLAAILAVVGNVAANRMASSVARDVTRNLRHDLFHKISYLSNRQVDGYTIPSLISRMTSDTYNVHQMVGMMQRIGIRAPILLIGGIVVTLTLDPMLTLVMLSVMPFIVVVTIVITKKGIPFFRKAQESIDVMVRVVRENAGGIRVIKALSKSDDEKAHFDTISRQVIDDEKRASITMAAMGPLMNLFLNLGLVMVILVGAWQVNRGVGEVGKIVAFMTYFTIILSAIMTISRIFTVYSRATASFLRIHEVLKAPPTMLPLPAQGPLVEPEYHLAFDHVSFSYNKKEMNISDISFRLKKGESLGIIGPTGSGKSTIAQLMMRFDDVDEGAIRMDGRDIREIETGDLRTRFGVVFQNDTIFEGNLEENIRLGRDISLADVELAAACAQAAEFIAGKEGYEGDVAIKGANLSGGQKQRILVARALAGNPDILILDDSSSALDYRTDAAMRKAVRENYRDTTTILIAQRVSTVMQCDHILVLDDGEVVGYGTHEQLLASTPLYQEMESIQMGEVAE